MLFSKQHIQPWLIMFGLLIWCSSAAAEEIDFPRDIAPILEQRCFHCHGEDDQESGLRLDRRENLIRGGDSGIATIVPGNPEKSYLIDVINHVDEDMAMPPDDDKLPAEEIELLTRWIKSGANWPGQMETIAQEKSDHWSFQPIVRPAVPTLPVSSRGTQVNASRPIDSFLLQSLAKHELTFSQPADPRSLIRRVSIVLTGVPPTPEETSAFVAASKTDSEQAYAELVDRLLDSPHFGERWAQHWLDVIRWAETNGSESNMYRKNAWIYRDYVIRAFNEDKPYDQFLFEQIAGDTVGQGDATGYLVAGPHVPIGTVGQEPTARRQARADRLDEVLQTVGASAMGMTIGCARCHNHKFDPISITDYYSMTAVFQDVEYGSRFPELSADHPRQIRGAELRKAIFRLQKSILETGPFETQRIGFQEIQFPSTRTDAVRVTFLNNWVQIDELEIYRTGSGNHNVALESSGTLVEGHSDDRELSKKISRINDGQYGTESWVGKGSGDDKPGVQFTFTDVQEINRIRMSANREDFLETDYLIDLEKDKDSPYKIEVRRENGTWDVVADTTQYKQLDKRHPERIAILAELQELIAVLNEEGPKPSFIAKFIQPVATHVFSRGSPESPRDEVFASGLTELDGELNIEPAASGKKRRQAFAKWLIAPSNPLTARVAANRLWHHVFGAGIVTTTSDFGAAGAPPTHPELLDWLAAELMQPTVYVAIEIKPWSMKHLIRLMVMSEAFRQSNLPRDEGLAVDAGSALLWRYQPQRVEAEVIRDSILQASGSLDTSIGGRSFRIHNVKKRYAQWEVTDNHGPETWRRMIYQERMRRVDDQLFTAFDFPDCGQVRAKRPVSTTPLQALNLMNSQFVIEQSQLIAVRAKQDSDGNESKSIDRCFELLLDRLPDEQERTACLELAKENDLSLVCRALINSNEFTFLP